MRDDTFIPPPPEKSITLRRFNLQVQKEGNDYALYDRAEKVTLLGLRHKEILDILSSQEGIVTFEVEKKTYVYALGYSCQ